MTWSADLPALLSPARPDAIRIAYARLSTTNAYRSSSTKLDYSLPGLIVAPLHDISSSLQILTQAMDTELVRSTVIAD